MKRRVIEFKPVGGKPGPDGEGTVFDLQIPDGVSRLLVLRRNEPTLVEELNRLHKASELLFKGTVGVLVLRPGDEVTLVELEE